MFSITGLTKQLSGIDHPWGPWDSGKKEGNLGLTKAQGKGSLSQLDTWILPLLPIPRPSFPCPPIGPVHETLPIPVL